MSPRIRGYLEPQNVTLLRDEVFSESRWGHAGLGWALNAVTDVLAGGRGGHAEKQAHRAEVHGKTEAETGRKHLVKR